MLAKVSIMAPEETMKSFALTPDPIKTGSSAVLFMEPFSSSELPCIVQLLPIFTAEILPVLMILHPSPIVPYSLPCLFA